MMSRTGSPIKNLLVRLFITTSCITATAFSASFRPQPSFGGSSLGHQQQQQQLRQPVLSRAAFTQTHTQTQQQLWSISRGGQVDSGVQDDEVLDFDLDLAVEDELAVPVEDDLVAEDVLEDAVPAIVDAPKGAPLDSQRLTPVPGNDLFDESGNLLESKKCCLAGMLAPIMGLGQSYATLLGSHPILTKSVTAGIIFGLSDWAAQSIESKGIASKSATEELKKGNVKQSAQTAATKAKSKVQDIVSNKKSHKLNQVRLVTSILVGLCYFGPAAHYWYEWIFALLPGTTIQSTMLKAALGQLVFGPVFTIIFFATSLMQSGDLTLGNLLQKIKSDLIGVWAAGLGFWPIVDFISYRSIPIPYIPLFVNFCSFVWTIYLSLVSNKSSTKGAAASA